MREGINKGDWISVEDGTPCLGEYVDIKTDSSEVGVGVAILDMTDIWWAHNKVAIAKVTHWRPIQD